MKYGVLNPLDKLTERAQSIYGGLIFALSSESDDVEFLVDIDGPISSEVVSNLTINGVKKITGYKLDVNTYSSSEIDKNVGSIRLVNSELGLENNMTNFIKIMELIKESDMMIIFDNIVYKESIMKYIKDNNKPYYLINTVTGKFKKEGV